MSLKILADESILVDRCLAEDREAQKLLYEKYKHVFYTIALRITGNPEDSKDALQDGFVNIFQSMANYGGKSSLYYWMKTIIVRASVQKIEKDILWRQIKDYEQSFLFTWDDDLTGEVLEQAIATLEKGYRTVFLLIEVEGYKHKEVAQLLNISEGTSKSQLYHAKKHLQKILKSYRL